MEVYWYSCGHSKPCHRLLSGFSPPQASSPMTSGGQATSPAPRRAAARLLPRRRWSIHTEVSRSTIQPGLRRGTGRAFGSEPPSAASRRADSRAMSASSPMRTSSVFRWTPVSRAAVESALSSMFSVVRMDQFSQKRMHASRNPSWDCGYDFGRWHGPPLNAHTRLSARGRSTPEPSSHPVHDTHAVPRHAGKIR